MGFGSAILVKTYTGHSLFFHLSFKHQDDIQYYNYSSSFSPHFNIQYFNIFKIILNTNANANANARDLLSDVGKLSWSPNSLICISDNGKNLNLLLYQKWACNSNFCEPNFQEFCLKWWRKELFLHCGDELSDCNCGGIFLMDKPFLKLGHYSSKAYWRGPLKFSKSGREITARIQYQMQSETQFFTNRNVIINPSIHFQIFFSVLK